MSYYRFAEMAVALCFGLTFALVGWWEIAGPIWREECSGSAEQWLEVASATLLGWATLVGTLFGAYEVLRREYAAVVLGPRLAAGAGGICGQPSAGQYRPPLEVTSAGRGSLEEAGR